MSWFGRGRKRGRPDAICQECEEEEIYFEEDDDWGVCGECQRTMCSDCMKRECGYCKDHDFDDWVTEGPSMCEMCMAWCEECNKAANEGKSTKGSTAIRFAWQSTTKSAVPSRASREHWLPWMKPSRTKSMNCRNPSSVLKLLCAISLLWRQ